MTISETAVPAAGSHPYPDDERDGITLRYERIASDCSDNIARWHSEARERVFRAPGRHAVVVAPEVFPVPAPASVTVPDAPVPAPAAAPVPEPLRIHRPSLFAKHGRHATGPKRDQAPERTSAFVRAPDSGTGTAAPPVPADDEAPTILPGSMAADEIQQQSAEALMRAGAKAADLAHLARPGDGRDAAEQVTAVIQRPADQGESK